MKHAFRLFAAICLGMMLLQLFATHAVPWMDEIHIVEMGRNVLAASDATATSILTNADGTSFTPLYYLGPVCHEMAFRLAGPAGVRLLPALALALASLFVFIRLRRDPTLPPYLALLASCVFLTLPFFCQSVRMARADTEVFLLASIILCLLDNADGCHRRLKLGAAAVLSVTSFFIWPSAFLLYPLYAALYFKRSRDSHAPLRLQLADLGWLFLAACVAALLLTIPLIPRLPGFLASFGQYFKGTGMSVATTGFDPIALLRGMAVQIVKEILREPFFHLFLPLGLIVCYRRQKLLLASTILALVPAALSGFHTFRHIYLYPYLFLIFVAGMCELHRHLPRTNTLLLVLTAVYGLVCGPITYAVADTRRAASEHARTQTLAETIGDRPATILQLDYSAYYACRRPGWHQIAGSIPSLAADDPLDLFSKATHVLVPEPDPYAAIEESPTLYGLLRDRALMCARNERHATHPSILARLGQNFLFDQFPNDVKTALRKRLADRHFKPVRRLCFAGWPPVTVYARSAPR